MSNEDQRGFFSRLISGVESSFRTLWSGIKYIGVGISQVLSGMIGLGPGIGKGAEKILTGAKNASITSLTNGLETIVSNENDLLPDLSDLLKMKSSKEIKQMCDDNPNLTISLIQDALRDNDMFSLFRFLDTGVNLNVCIGGKSPLLCAVEYVKPELMKAMLDHGANPNLQGVYQSDSCLVSDTGYTMAKILLESGARPDSPLFGYFIDSERLNRLVTEMKPESNIRGLSGVLEQAGEIYPEGGNAPLVDHSLSQSR